MFDREMTDLAMTLANTMALLRVEWCIDDQ